MGYQTLGLLMVLYTMSCFLFISTSSVSLHRALFPSDSAQEINWQDKGSNSHGTADIHNGGKLRKGILSSSLKIGRGAGFGGAGAGIDSARPGSNENIGVSKSGGALIPVYAAGSHKKRHLKGHRTSSDSSLKTAGLPAIIMPVLLSLAFVFNAG